MLLVFRRLGINPLLPVEFVEGPAVVFAEVEPAGGDEGVARCVVDGGFEERADRVGDQDRRIRMRRDRRAEHPAAGDQRQQKNW